MGLLYGSTRRSTKGIRQVNFLTRLAGRRRVDDPNLVSSAGLLPVVGLAKSAGLAALVQERLSVPTDKGANAGLKVTSLVAGMVAGADSIDDMAFCGTVGCAGSSPRLRTLDLGLFLRAFTFDDVRPAPTAVASRFVIGLADQTPLMGSPRAESAQTTGTGHVLVDVDDTVVEVHGYAKQGAGFGYSGSAGSTRSWPP